DSLRFMPSLSTIIWVVIGVGIGFILWKSGVGLLRSFNAPVTTPPPPGEMRKVNVRYRCSVCGLEIKMTLAPDEDPPPPRHCLEDMDIVPPLYDVPNPQPVDNPVDNDRLVTLGSSHRRVPASGRPLSIL